MANQIAQVITAAQGGAVNDTTSTAGATGSTTGVTSSSVFDVSAASGFGASTTDSTSALAQLANIADTGMQAINNADAASGMTSSALGSAAGQALENRSQSSLQAGGQTLMYLAIIGVAGFVLWGIFRGKK